MCQICNTMLCQIDETIAEQNYSQKSRVFRRNIFTNFLKKNKVLKFHYYHCQHSFVMNFGQVVLLLDQEFYALFLISSLDERYILKVPHCPWPGLVLDLGHPADRLPPNDTEKPKRAPWPIDAGNRIHGRVSFISYNKILNALVYVSYGYSGVGLKILCYPQGVQNRSGYFQPMPEKLIFNFFFHQN